MSLRTDRIEKLAALFRWPQAAGVSLALFLMASAPGLILDGRTPDDWRQVHGAPVGGMPLNWTTEEGRWLMEVIFVHLLGERFLPALQAGLAAIILFLASAMIARAAIGVPYRPIGTVFLFTFGVHHLYMVNALSFSSHVFAYPLALMLSLGAFALFRKASEREPARAIFMMIGAAQLLAFSAAIYQPFAPFGAVLLFVAFLRMDEVDDVPLVRFAVFAAVGTVLGGLIYGVEAQIAAALHPHEPLTERVTVASGAVLVAKAVELPFQFLRVWAGTLQFIPLWLKLVNAGFFAMTGVLVLAVTFRDSGGNRAPWIAVTRVLIGAAGLTVLLPLFVWLVNDSGYFPSRIVAFAGFLLGALYLTVAGVFMNRTSLRPLLVGVPAAFAAVHVMVAAAAWSDQTEAGRRDEDLARTIMARVSATEGYDGGPFRIVGAVSYDDLSWGDFLGWTSFHEGTPEIGIFKAMFHTGWYAETGLFEAPLACPSFPAYGSVYLHDGIVYVCLSESEGFENASLCADSENDKIGQVCVMDRAIVRFRDACDLAPDARRILFTDPAQPDRVATFFNIDVRGLRTSEGCVYTSGWGGAPPETLLVSVVEADGTESWSETLSLMPQR